MNSTALNNLHLRFKVDHESAEYRLHERYEKKVTRHLKFPKKQSPILSHTGRKIVTFITVNFRRKLSTKIDMVSI